LAVKTINWLNEKDCNCKELSWRSLSMKSNAVIDMNLTEQERKCVVWNFEWERKRTSMWECWTVQDENEEYWFIWMMNQSDVKWYIEMRTSSANGCSERRIWETAAVTEEQRKQCHACTSWECWMLNGRKERNQDTDGIDILRRSNVSTSCPNKSTDRSIDLMGRGRNVKRSRSLELKSID
jgi:hypothetical protein